MNNSEKRVLIREEEVMLFSNSLFVTFVGTMKSGKSTTINAIIGQEIFPARNTPMTSSPTLIKHVVGQKEPKLLLDGNDYTGAQNIMKVLTELNDSFRDIGKKYLDYAEKKLVVEIEFEFLKTFNHDRNINFFLCDTPGANEFGQTQLSTILECSLNKASIVIWVIDYSQRNTEAERELRKQIYNSPAAMGGRLFVVINRIDQYEINSANSDTPEIACKKVEKESCGKISREKIFPISAKKAYLANMAMKNISEFSGLVKSAYRGWRDDFARIAFGECYEPDDLAELGKVKNAAEALWKKSGIEIVLKAFRYIYSKSQLIAVESALDGIAFTNKNDISQEHWDFYKNIPIFVNEMFSESRQKIREILTKYIHLVKDIALSEYQESLLQDSRHQSFLSALAQIMFMKKSENEPPNFANENFEILLNEDTEKLLNKLFSLRSEINIAIKRVLSNANKTVDGVGRYTFDVAVKFETSQILTGKRKKWRRKQGLFGKICEFLNTSCLGWEKYDDAVQIIAIPAEEEIIESAMVHIDDIVGKVRLLLKYAVLRRYL